MIEVLTGFPDGVVAMSAKGRVSKGDYDAMLIPKLNEALQKPGKVRFYYEFGPAFSEMEAAAMWEDFKFGVEHLTRWERIAVVTDVDWIRMAMNAFRFILPRTIRIFGTREATDARRWIAAD